MKVRELVDILKTKKQDLEVTVDGYEYGLTSLRVENILEQKVIWEGNEEPTFGGEHDDGTWGEAETVTVLNIGRS